MAVQALDSQFTLLEKVNKVVQSQFAQDVARVPEMWDTLNSASSSKYTIPPNEAWVPFHKRKTVPIPEGLFLQYEPTTSKSAMGLLLEIDRAWITINHKLFLWDYVDGTHCDRYEEQPNFISFVGLVKPKPGVFVDSIQYLLILCTPVSVSLIGLGTTTIPATNKAPPRKELNMFATDISLPTDNIQMTSVVGTSSGRIFMCGSQDGNLYELNYQAKEGWFSRRCSLINHSAGGMGSFLPSILAAKSTDRIKSVVLDDARCCLYALTEHSAIHLYYLGRDGSAATPARIAVASNLAAHAQQLCPGSASLNSPFEISAVHVIPVSDSKGVHLVAITTTGARLYFSHYKRTYGSYRPTGGPNFPPSVLELIHVRTPPTSLADPDQPFQRSASSSVFQPTTKPWAVKNIHSSAYDSGLFFMAQTPDGVKGDILLGLAPDLSKIANYTADPSMAVSTSAMATSQAMGAGFGGNKTTLTEFAQLTSVTGNIWAISSVSTSPLSEPLGWNELTTQFSTPTKQFLVLTNDGLTIYAKRRAVDCLRDLIEAARRGHEGDVISPFFERYGRDQSCTMCLAIACSNSFISTFGRSNSAALARSYGHRILQNGTNFDDSLSLQAVDEPVAAAAKSIFYELGGKPLLMEGFANENKILHSGRYEALAIYFSRLVRPIWRANITTGPLANQVTNVPDHLLVSVQKDLTSLKYFLERNPQLFHSPSDYSHSRSSADQEAWKTEQDSIVQLQTLLTQTIEAISFILLLIDYKLPETVALCDPQVQQALLGLTYEGLLTTKLGRDVARNLVNSVINQQIGQHISVDTISEILQQRCGSFCSSDDVMLYKAIENIQRAKETRDMGERAKCLRESLRLFGKSTKHLPLDNLKEICSDYRELKYPNGAVELPLKCAQDWDLEDRGHAFWAAGLPFDRGDARESAYRLKTTCYDCVLETLDAFDTLLNQCTDETIFRELESLQENAYRLALDSDDPVFHSYLYDWFIKRGRTDQLLEIRSNFIESHLSHPPRTREKIELLWQLYVRNGQNLRAAQTLAHLAESREFALTLEKRIEFLSLAVSNAKSHPGTDFGQQEAAVEFLTDIEEKLEVANMQLEVYRAMQSAHVDHDYDQKMEALRTTLMDVTQLYQEFADPYELYDMKLYILKVSEHRDPILTASTWRALIARTAHEAPGSKELYVAEVVRKLGRKLYPSDNAFPVDNVCDMLLQFASANKDEVPRGWVARTLVDASVPPDAVFEQLHYVRDLGVPPFHEESMKTFVLAEISCLLSDWVNEAIRPGSRIPRGAFPANMLDEIISGYLGDRQAVQDEDTRDMLQDVQAKIRSRF
ncbi:hypothetical protein BOTBODRAFT_26554 [Botryobasidium botryosum FD-172 SS1]|uniref:Nucleoporin Nup133/Nup155-like N-terminal domain-containing protein n=1 Tax=Botryobasidium botryosum (strain FD-172 SS1) TaxID=930990 RepID=A0A067N0Q3_BOTB1|nr:hypothetical protein BOTBODRAFT_26554 [Botryobasidium botryosum FD-172 SS1]